MDYFLDHRLKLKIVEYLAHLLLIYIFPKYLNTDSKSSPSYSWKLNCFVICNRIGNGRRRKCMVQFDVDFFDSLTKFFVSWGRSDKKCPPIFVILFDLQNLSGVTNQKASHDSFLYDLLFVIYGLRITCLKLVPKWWLGNNLVLSKLSPTEWASAILNDQCCLCETILTKKMLAFD